MGGGGGGGNEKLEGPRKVKMKGSVKKLIETDSEFTVFQYLILIIVNQRNVVRFFDRFSSFIR